MTRSRFEIAPSQSRRSGFTLIELLAVVTMTLVIAGSACVLISKMLKASHVQADTLVQQRTLHLWESQFRQDGRQAQSAQLVAGPAENRSITFQHATRWVTYQVIPAGVERRVNGELGGRWESGTGEWEFTVIEGGRLVRAEFRQLESISLSKSVPLPPGTPPPPQWPRTRVEVALGSQPAPPMPEGGQ